MRRERPFRLTVALALLAAPVAQAQGTYNCNNPIAGPDLIVGSINDICVWGSIGPTSAYSIGATSCNVGDAAMEFSGNGTHHPVIAQNLYRFDDGRFVQLGQSWVKHAFASATEDLCCTCQDPGDPLMIGVGCADTYLHCQNGVQGPIMQLGSFVSGLGPRSDINPVTGAFPWPYTTFGMSGDALYKRLQVEVSDLSPTNFPNAKFFAEVHYVGPDEGGIDKTHNNASYREVEVGAFAAATYDINLIGTTKQMEPGILAWKAQDSGVMIDSREDSQGGRFYVGSRATDNGDGTWNYEYAVYNMNSAKPARGVKVPIGLNVALTNIGFRDVDSHSGEPYDTTDWGVTTSVTDINWTTGAGVNANAVRWGTLYNYWFTADVEPSPASVTLDLLTNGALELLQLDIVAPTGTACSDTNYCLGLPNSAGTVASIGFTGSTSFVANDLVLTASGVVPNAFGLFYYGENQVFIPFGDGIRCVGGATQRLGPPQSANAQGIAERSIDYASPPMNSGFGMVTVGSDWNFQFWYRDNMGVTGFNLSDGLNIVFCR